MYNAVANSKIGKLLGMEPVALSSEGVANNTEGDNDTTRRCCKLKKSYRRKIVCC